MNQIKDKKPDKREEYCFPSFETFEIKDAFDCFDVNHKGYIGVTELKEIFSVIQEEVSDEEMDEMIKMADKEGDGQVNWLNFFEFITNNGINQELSKVNNNIIDISPKGNEFSKANYQIIGEKTQRRLANQKANDSTEKEKKVLPSIIEDIKPPLANKSIDKPKEGKKHIVIKKKSQSQETASGRNNNNFEVVSNTNTNNLLIPNRGLSETKKDGDNSKPKQDNFISSMLMKNKAKEKQFEVVAIDNKPKRNLIVLKPSQFEEKELQEKEEDKKELIPDVAGMRERLFKPREITEKGEEEERDSSREDDKPIGNDKDIQLDNSEAFKGNTSLIDKMDPVIDKIENKEVNNAYDNHLRAIQQKINPQDNAVDSFVSYQSKFQAKTMKRADSEETNEMNIKQISIKSKTSQHNSLQSDSETPQIASQGNKKDSNSKASNVIIASFDHEPEVKIISDHSVSGHTDNKLKDSGLSRLDLEEEENRMKKEQEIEELVCPPQEEVKENWQKMEEEENEEEDSEDSKEIKHSSQEREGSPIRLIQKESIRESIRQQKDSIKASIIKQHQREVYREYSIKQQNQLNSLKTPDSKIETLQNQEKPNDQPGASAIIIEAIPIKDNSEQSNNQLNSNNENDLEDNSAFIIIDGSQGSSKPSNIPTNPKYPRNNLIKDHSIDSQGQKKDDEGEGKAILRKRPLSKPKDTIEHSKPLHKPNSNKNDSEIIIANSEEDSNQSNRNPNSLSFKSSLQSHESKRKAQLMPKGVFPKIKRDIIRKFILKEQITPEIIKAFYSKFEFQSSLYHMVSYEDFLKSFEFSDSPECKDFFDAFRTINSDEHVMSISDSLILLLNGTNLHKEEKFKFEFLCFDKDKSKFLSKEDLLHLLELNFLSNTTSDINIKFQLIINEIKKMNIYDTEVYDYDVLFEIVEQKPNLFFPY